MFELNDKVVLVTGAANGVGAGVVRFLLDEGVKHVAILDVDEVAGVSFQNELNAKYSAGVSKFYKCDVTNDEQLFGAFDDVLSTQGSLDVVVNNAGIMNDDYKVYRKQIAINVTALISSTLKAIELMRKDQGGSGGTVINIGSTIGLDQKSFLPIYAGTKSAVMQFSNCIGKEDYYKQTGVRVIVVCFGPTDTALFSSEKLGTHDAKINNVESIFDIVKQITLQRLESAARGVIDAYKKGKSGSTWVVSRDVPAVDITTNVAKAFDILGKHINTQLTDSLKRKIEHN